MSDERSGSGGMEPEGAGKIRPFTEDQDTEAHGIRSGHLVDEPGSMEPDGAVRGRPLTDDQDTEGQGITSGRIVRPRGLSDAAEDQDTEDQDTEGQGATRKF